MLIIVVEELLVFLHRHFKAVNIIRIKPYRVLWSSHSSMAVIVSHGELTFRNQDHRARLEVCPGILPALDQRYCLLQQKQAQQTIQ